jgi:N-acetylglucosamine kinase-like BadF-type ATPase
MMPITHHTLAIDAGQTGMRVMHIAPADASHHSVKTIRDFAGIRTDRELLPQLVDVVTAFCAQTALPMGTVAAGVSGLTDKESHAGELLAALRPLGVSSVYVAHDSITGFLGSLGDQPGAVVAAGTGVVTLGVGPLGMARVDGWGHIIGDAGSGYWIGRAALEAAMRAHDGRGSVTSLSALVTENFSTPETAYIELQTNPDRVRLIASFAKQVADHAESDDVALSIMRSAGEQLALSVATALRRVGSPAGEDPRVSWAGSLLTGRLLHAEFEAALRRLVTNVVITAPQGLPLDGVALLPSLALDNPLRTAVKIA